MSPSFFPSQEIKIKEYPALPAGECLAKTRQVWRNGEWQSVEGCDLYTHLRATCEMLRTLREIWKGYPLAAQITEASEALAAFHDIGKATPAFQEKIYTALGRTLPWKGLVEDVGGHPRNSEIVLNRYGREFARMAGCHHGGANWSAAGRETKEELGGKAWEELRKELLARLKTELKLSTEGLKEIHVYLTTTVGAVILADWLSSGMDLPHGGALPKERDYRTTVENAGLVPVHWKEGLSFEELFGFSPNLLQKACEGIAAPGKVYVIESGMGSGKTEAALFLAHQLLSCRQANGAYFAMPTKLTSEKIYERLNCFLQKGGDAVEEERSKALLIHGDAWLNWILEEPREEGGKASGARSSWFQTRKRALLAPFAAGTVDQALLSVINVKHRDLRAFALSGKVVIFDEVHSYDAYTGSLIVSLVRKLREWGATTIILSATLTNAARQRLLGVSESADAAPRSYPLISISDGKGGEVEYREFAATQSAEVKLSQTSELADAYGAAYEHATRGEQVLWIVNTVDQAQEIYRQLTTFIPADVELGLIHSRFPSCIRREQEEHWVDILGKNGAAERRQKGRILVATQVLEQSVDVDADFLVTQVAPSDMLFQRIGRLWRHRTLDAVRPAEALRETLVVFPENAESPETWQKRELALPYDSYCMWRSALLWRERPAVHLPDDIRPILEATYREREEEDGVAQSMRQERREKQSKMEQKAAVSQGVAFGTLDDDENAVTRCGDMETVQVLLLKKGNAGLPLKKAIAPYFSDSPILLPPPEASHWEKARIAASIMKTLVTVPVYSAPKYGEFSLEFLRDVIWVGDDDSRPIRAAYVNDDGTLMTQSCLPVDNKKTLSYHTKLGYCALKK